MAGKSLALHTTDPHLIACQWCYIAYDICDGKQCVHDVHEPSGLNSRRAAYVGFCSRYCRATRAKGSRAGRYVDNIVDF